MVGVGDLFLFFGWFQGQSRRGSGCHPFRMASGDRGVRGTTAIAAFLKASGVRHPHGLGALRAIRRTRFMFPEGACEALQRFWAAFRRFPGPIHPLCLPNPARLAVFGACPLAFNPGVSPFLNRLHWLEEGLRGFSRGFGQNSSSMRSAVLAQLHGP